MNVVDVQNSNGDNLLGKETKCRTKECQKALADVLKRIKIKQTVYHKASPKMMGIKTMRQVDPTTCNRTWNQFQHGKDWNCICAGGKRQSPIDLPGLNDLQEFYNSKSNVGANSSVHTSQKHSFLVGQQPDLNNNISDDINLSTQGAGRLENSDVNDTSYKQGDGRIFASKIMQAFRFREPDGNLLEDLVTPKPIHKAPKKPTERKTVDTERWSVSGDGNFASPDGGDELESLAETHHSAQLMAADPMKFPQVVNHGVTLQVEGDIGFLLLRQYHKQISFSPQTLPNSQQRDARQDVRHVSFHSPSEHTLNGWHYDLEMQIVATLEESYDVHVDSTQVKKTALIAILFDASAHGHSHFLDQIGLDELPAHHGYKRALADHLDFNKLFVKDTAVQDNSLKLGSFQVYEGSQTTPSCAEEAIWLVKAIPVQAGTDQVFKLRQAMLGNAIKDGNNRLPQMANCRPILVHDDKLHAQGFDYKGDPDFQQCNDI